VFAVDDRVPFSRTAELADALGDRAGGSITYTAGLQRGDEVGRTPFTLEPATFAGRTYATHT
jgi:hypothetical protein